ncbi:MAG: hypothetical protein IJE88_02765, partial [Akkermansia sp.]|nr:hypothetical protein [Akkermansia sp.]
IEESGSGLVVDDMVALSPRVKAAEPAVVSGPIAMHSTIKRILPRSKNLPQGATAFHTKKRA